MTHTDVRDWINANIDRKMREFGVPHFRFEIIYEALENCKMNCKTLPDYERATIRIDPADYQHDETPETLEHDFEHELMHVVHSPFEVIRGHLYELMADEPAPRWNAVADLFNRCCEMTVRNMERMTFGLREAEKTRVEGVIVKFTEENRGVESAGAPA